MNKNHGHNPIPVPSSPIPPKWRQTYPCTKHGLADWFHQTVAKCIAPQLAHSSSISKTFIFFHNSSVQTGLFQRTLLAKKPKI